ncbi:MAG: signal peptidase II [Fibrobacter sp.]|nr:signal peptidase II [Fibrobacter sp.]
MKNNNENLELQVRTQLDACNIYPKSSNVFIKYFFVLLFLFSITFLDIYTKQLAITNLKGKPSVCLNKSFLDVGYSENRGMVFGILNDSESNGFKFVFTGFRIIILLVVTVFLFMARKGSFWHLFPFYLIWSGAAGNLIDSFLYGFVVDFIHLHIGTVFDWPFFFNIADAWLCIAMAILFINSFMPVKKHVSNFLYYPA